MPNMRWHLTLMAPRTRTNLAPNSSFNRALIRSAMVRKSKHYVVGVGHVDEFHALDFFGPFGLGFMLGAEVAIDDRHMAERLCVVMNSGGVVGRIHQIVEIGDAGAGHGHHVSLLQNSVSAVNLCDLRRAGWLGLRSAPA